MGFLFKQDGLSKPSLGTQIVKRVRVSQLGSFRKLRVERGRAGKPVLQHVYGATSNSTSITADTVISCKLEEVNNSASLFASCVM